ncbi:DapH/DapD/GlmU-related protein [Oleiagrimonas soli]|nr:DapH/DapD/GlmU-related protein [Oleiagrimonas soli]MBB6184225.1 UDP-3-O-[3-hydroxymyristoyl] glucosamine N-acyltransferase [Oleiagrimonas soli]
MREEKYMTSGWEDGIAETLARLRDEFQIIRVDHPERLSHARQTGFVWTRRPGIVCLAVNRFYFRLAIDNPDVDVIIAPENVAQREPCAKKALIVSHEPEVLYHYLHTMQKFVTSDTSPSIDDSAYVDDSALLRGDIRIGKQVRIGPRVVIEGPASIADGVVIEAGAIIGCEGLYAKTIHGNRRHIPHFGGIEIREDAFIHAGAVIVRSAIMGENTHIGKRVHIGVQSTIGHDVTIHDDATISSNVLIAGRARVGARTWIGASATISNTVEIGEDANVRIGAVVVRNVPAGADVSGNLARQHKRVMREYMEDIRDEH